MGSNDPIGIFDSGMGGLSVWKELYTSLPHESLIYYGDGLNCPYGGKTDQQIQELACAALDYFASQNVKLAVVACNTATAAAIDMLRSRYDMPIVGMEPAVKPAALSTKTGVVAILATEASFRGALFKKTAQAYGHNAKIITAVGKGFVELVEDDMEDSVAAYQTVARVIEPLIEKGADRLVLGCTHYTFLSDVIREVIGSRDVELVDAAPAIERRVEYILKENSIAANVENIPFYEFYTLADGNYISKLRSKSEKIKGLAFEE